MPNWASRPLAERWALAQEIRVRYGSRVREYEEQRVTDYAEGERLGWTRTQVYSRFRRGAMDESPLYRQIAEEYGTTTCTAYEILHGRRHTGPQPIPPGRRKGQAWNRASVKEEALIIRATAAGYGPSAIARALTTISGRPVARTRVWAIRDRLRREGRIR
jgi:hypothetical protein